MDEEIVIKETYELLFVLRGRSRPPWGWNQIRGGLDSRSQLTAHGLVLTISTDLLQEARRLLREIYQQSWRNLVASPLIRKRQTISKWIPVPKEEWAEDYFEQSHAEIEQPFLLSVGILTKPTTTKELPAHAGESDPAKRQYHEAADERDLELGERKGRRAHRLLEHQALMPKEILRQEAEDEAAWQKRKARYERDEEAALQRIERETQEAEEARKREHQESQDIWFRLGKSGIPPVVEVRESQSSIDDNIIQLSSGYLAETVRDLRDALTVGGPQSFEELATALQLSETVLRVVIDEAIRDGSVSKQENRLQIRDGPAA